MFWWILLWIVIGLAGLLLAYILLLIISAMLVDMERDYEQESKFYRFLLNSATSATGSSRSSPSPRTSRSPCSAG